MHDVRVIILLVAVFLFCPFDCEAQLQSVEPCSAGDLRQLVVSVTNRNGEAVRTLQKEDLILKEDGISSRVTRLNLLRDQKLDVVILIDTSVSQEKMLVAEKLAAGEFVKAILQEGNDRAALVSFSSSAKIEQSLTRELNKVSQSLVPLTVVVPPGYRGGGIVVGPPISPTPTNLPGSTSLWDATHDVIDQLFDTSDQSRKRVLLMLTNGDDTSSKVKPDKIAELAVKQHVILLSIGFVDPDFGGNPGVLKKLSEETGGISGVPRQVKDIAQILDDMAQTLKSSYLVDYCPVTTSHKKLPVKVRVEPAGSKEGKLNFTLTYPHMRF